MAVGRLSGGPGPRALPGCSGRAGALPSSFFTVSRPALGADPEARGPGARAGRNNPGRGNDLFFNLVHLPGFIYDRLPAIHVAAGILCGSNLELRGPGGLSAALLVAAGLLTGLWRYRQRWLSAGRHWPATTRSGRGAGPAFARGRCRRMAGR